MFGILIFMGIMALVIISVAGQLKKEQERTLAIENAAKSLGFTFNKTTMVNFDFNSSKFKIFNTGNSRYCKNVMEQKGNDLAITHFDYSYTVGSGKNRSIYVQTVTVFVSKKLRLPDFVMGPENFFHKLGDIVGLKDIDFDDAPEFSKSYLLKGDNENAIRSFFDSTVLSFFKDKPGFAIESSTDSCVIYNKAKKIPADQILQVLKERIDIYNVFSKRSSV